MANFNPPIASVGGVTRAPTVLEKANGLQCGPADLKLFNFLFQKIQAELKSIQDAGGITGDDGDDTTVLQAIQELISIATGGGDVSTYVTFPLAQARLPIFPEVTTNNGVITVTDLLGGNIQIPAATIVHRGIRAYTPGVTDLATTASKIYHLRWNPTTGYALKDLADSAGYNPTLAAETSPIFDSTYDDMLVARIITNASNVPAITNLMNKQRLRFRYSRGILVYPGIGGFPPEATETIDYNFGRTPDWVLHGFSESELNVTPGSITDGSETNFKAVTRTRYNSSVRVMSFSHVSSARGRPEYEASFVCLD